MYHVSTLQVQHILIEMNNTHYSAMPSYTFIRILPLTLKHKSESSEIESGKDVQNEKAQRSIQLFRKLKLLFQKY